MRNTPSLKILVSAIKLEAFQITYWTVSEVSQVSSFWDKVLSRKQCTAKKSLTNFAENVPS